LTVFHGPFPGRANRPPEQKTPQNHRIWQFHFLSNAREDRLCYTKGLSDISRAGRRWNVGGVGCNGFRRSSDVFCFLNTDLVVDDREGHERTKEEYRQDSLHTANLLSDVYRASGVSSLSSLSSFRLTVFSSSSARPVSQSCRRFLSKKREEAQLHRIITYYVGRAG